MNRKLRTNFYQMPDDGRPGVIDRFREPEPSVNEWFWRRVFQALFVAGVTSVVVILAELLKNACQAVGIAPWKP